MKGLVVRATFVGLALAVAVEQPIHGNQITVQPWFNVDGTTPDVALASYSRENATERGVYYTKGRHSGKTPYLYRGSNHPVSTRFKNQEYRLPVRPQLSSKFSVDKAGEDALAQEILNPDALHPDSSMFPQSAGHELPTESVILENVVMATAYLGAYLGNRSGPQAQNLFVELLALDPAIADFARLCCREPRRIDDFFDIMRTHISELSKEIIVYDVETVLRNIEQSTHKIVRWCATIVTGP
ncbi:MAG: hypothetical protein LBR89_03700 [Holosporales bacterium]|jgi:hypothetical protein|nr:hypothetical protein [Holosporales bacterium]